MCLPYDAELNRSAVPQGGATLAGSVLDIYNRSTNSVVVSGKTCAPGTVVATITTDATGTATTANNLLPYGDYEIVERTPPTGYLNTGVIRQTFQIRDSGVIVSLKTASTVIKNNVVRGGVEVEKWDADLNRRAVAQGDASLTGAVLEIWNRSAGSVLVGGKEYAPNTVVYTMTTDASGWAGTANDLLPYGSYQIIEKTPPTGYLGAGVTQQTFNITANGVVVSLKTASTAIKNNTIRGGVEIEKWDAGLNRTSAPQGDATLAGAILEIWNRSAGSVMVGGTEYAPNTVVYTMTTDAKGWAGTANDVLPYGSYEIIEKTPPAGYLGTGVLSQTFQIRASGVIVSLKSSDKVIKNNVIRGGIEIEKWDFDLNRRAAPQGDASLDGAVFEVWNRSPHSVLVGGVEYAPGTVVCTISTDANGWAGTANNLLPYGSYEIKEKVPPTGYLNTGVISQSFQIRVDGVIVSLKTSDTTIKNNVIRGGVEIEKWDIERNAQALKQGDATLAGAVFEIWNRSAHSVVVGGVEYAPGAVVYTITTDATGWAGTANNLLPYGSYEIVEKTPPVGYLNTGVTSQSFQIRENGVVVSLKSNDTVIKNDVIRGGVEIEKWDVELNRRVDPQGDATLADAVFEIWNRSADVVWVGGKEYAPNTVVYTMTTNADGWAGTANDLLPYGSYEIIEKTPPTGYLPTGVLSQSFQVRQDGVIVSLKTSGTVIKNDVVRGGVEIEKWDIERSGQTLKQGDSTLAGAVLEIWNRSAHSVMVGGVEYDPDTVVYTMTTDKDGWAGTANTLLPYGSYEIIEKTPPMGYLNTGVISQSFEIRENGVVVSLKTDDTVIKNDVIRGGIEIEKWDNELNRRADPQGDATLEGAVFEIWNRSANTVLVGGVEYAPGTMVYTITTDADGWAGTANNLLPYGSYEIIEKEPPAGYLPTGVLRQSFQIRENGVIISLKTSDTVIKNNVIRGGVEIEKWDIERNGQALKQGDATLEGAVFEIWNRSTHSVWVGGVEYAPDAVVYTMTTNVDGWAGTVNNLLPYGSYEIIETKPPEGYLNTGVISRSFEIREDGVIVSLTTEDTTIKNDVIRSGVEIEKWDNEINEHRAQGGAALEGAVFELVNRSADSVVVQDVLYGVGDVVYTFSTDSTGTALTPDDLLPYGTYEVREVSPPAGYLATGILSRTFTIREQGVVVDLSTSDTAIKNNPIRGDLKGVKIADADASRMADVPFRITSVTTGESHVIVTDTNGQFDTSSDWNPHSQNTNQGETDRDGVWFGDPSTLNDNLGALLYDTYLIEELPCAANQDKELLSFTVSVYRHNNVINLGTLTDDSIVKPDIFTTAMDQETATNSAYVSATTTIIDTVYYSGLTVGKEYTVKGILMDKETGEPLLVNGEPVTAETTFKAASDTGSDTMKFTFDSSALKGKSVVVFESLEFKGNEIAAHADIDDEDQTVTFVEPKIGTTAAGPNGEKELALSADVTIVDTVSYEGLVPGLPYTVKGTLMDKGTGEPLLVDGNEVTAETMFTPTEASGTVDVTFTFNGVGLSGTTVVVFESLEFHGQEIAVHANIEDEAQSVELKEAPVIGTTATGQDGGKEIPIGKEVTIVDVVAYANLTVGETYVLKGVLMDKATGEPLLVDGKEVTAETTFTPTETSGTVDVTFTLNSSGLVGKTVVVFESLEYQEKEIAVHTDIEDEAQTVTFTVPTIGTSAADKDGGKVIPIGKKVTIVDTVAYTNLTVGEPYVVKGVLMDKTTGEPLLIGGKEVTAETTFTPTETSGTVDVTFTLDSTDLKGKTVVVFESLEYEGKEIAVHADIEDEDQTVTFSDLKIGTTATGKDGGKTIPLDKWAVINDVVTYSDLTVGETYVMRGILMDKATGEPLLVDGKEVVALTTFTPESTSGSVEVTFTFDSTALAGKTLVVFESLEYEGATIAEHRDLSDKGQTVVVEKPGGSPQTGRDGLPIWMLILSIAALAGCVTLILYIRKKNKQDHANK